MSQKRIDLVAQREQAVHLLRAGQSVQEVAKALNRHENWVRKWRKRHQNEGWAGLAGRSHAPKKQGRALSAQMRQAICQARSELEAEAAGGKGLKYIGPLAVRTKLQDKEVSPLPSRASIERVLKDKGMTRKKEKPEEDKVEYPHLKPSQPHQLGQVDIVPHFLSGGERMACFNGIDVVSRYATGLPFSQRRAQDAAQFLVHLWQEVGIACYTQVDNEGCFSGGATHPYVLGTVVRLALNVDTELLFSPFYHPQSNSSVERFHQDYNRHVWQDTYLHDRADIRERGQTFFSLYRHSRHHSQLKGLSPDQCHHQQPPTKLSSDFSLPLAKLPLREGRIHFIRPIVPAGTIKVLNALWHIPDPDFLKGVWVTLEFKLTGAILSIYNAAPDALERQCLTAYPFPISEPILPHPSKDKAHQFLTSEMTTSSTSLNTVCPSSPASPPLSTQLPLPGTQPFWAALTASSSRLVNRIFHTIC